MNDEQIKLELEEIVKELHNPANQFAKLDWVKRTLDFMAFVKPARYGRLWRAIWSQNVTEKEWSALEPISDRLERLAIRLQDDGLYTDSEICWQALEKIKKTS